MFEQGLHNSSILCLNMFTKASVHTVDKPNLVLVSLVEVTHIQYPNFFQLTFSN